MTASARAEPVHEAPETVVASVRALETTPVKGLRLLTRQAVRLELPGVVDNRRFYVIDERNRMVNGKQIGTLSAVVAAYDHRLGSLALTFPDGEVVAATINVGRPVATRFFSRELTADLIDGPWAAALSAHAGRALRVVMARRESGGIDRGTAGAVSLISRASVAELERLAGRRVDPRRFRMLVEVDGVEARAEDDWIGQRMRIGEALVLMHGHVGRCLVTGQDPDTGVANMPTLDLLRSYRQGLDTTEPLAFGVFGEVIEPGAVRLGDPVRHAADGDDG